MRYQVSKHVSARSGVLRYVRRLGKPGILDHSLLTLKMDIALHYNTIDLYLTLSIYMSSWTLKW